MIKTGRNHQHLNFMAFDHKKNILSQQFLAMAPKMVGIKYSSDIVKRAFLGTMQHHRTLYNRVRDDFLLSSLGNIRKDDVKTFKT